MGNSPSFVSEPQVTDLAKLLSDVRSGHIQVPRFQRPFVWDDERRVELLRSIRAGIPIGSLLVWRTSQRRLSCFERIAGVAIPGPGEGQTISYLLDGHQRVTTLFAAFDTRPATDSRAPEADEEAARPSTIYFDLEHDDFVAGEAAPDRLCVPVHLFLNAVLLRRYFRELERTEKVAPERVDALQSKAEEVLYAIQWCRIPVVPLTTDDVELATRTFHRVNSQGLSMTEIHMVAALTWGERFDLRQEFEDAWRQAATNLPPGWSPAPEQQALNVLKGLFNLEIAKQSGDLLVRRIRERPDAPRQAVLLLSRAMGEASRFVSLPGSVPYQMQLTLTAISLQDLSDADLDRDFLRRWWGLTTAWGSFASAASHRVQAALRHLRLGLGGKAEPWPPLLYASAYPEPLPLLDLRNARARAFVDRYAVTSGQGELLRERGSRALVSLVRGASSRPGNRFLWPAERLAELTDLLAAGNLDRLAGHFVSHPAAMAWQRGDLDDFYSLREVQMQAEEDAWFTALKPEAFVRPPSQG